MAKRRRRAGARNARLARLGERLIELRDKSGLKQEEVAERASMSRSHLSRLENGHTDPATEDLYALAGVFGVSPAELLDEPPGQRSVQVRPLLDDPEAETYVVRLGAGLRRADEREERLVKEILRTLADQVDPPGGASRRTSAV